MAGKTTVVLLEDDSGLRALIADGLRDQRYPVVETGSAAEASAAVERLAGHAILVADRSLGPDTPNGFEAAAGALARYPALRAIYVSGTHIVLRHRKLSDRERRLPKPFALSQLVELVRELDVRGLVG